MGKLIILILILIIVICFAKFLDEKAKKNKGKYNFIERYRKLDALLTPTELDFYKQLMLFLPEGKGVSFKVRLIDILKPNATGLDYKVSKSKVLSKHVDFVIFNKENTAIDMAIELDDKSHESRKNLERDEFKNRAFESANMPLYRIKVGRNYSEQLRKIFQ